MAAVAFSVADGTTDQRGAATDANDSTWLQAAIEATRAVIAKPTGSGAIRGVCELGGVNYCIRDNVGGTAAVLYKESTSGWVAQDLGYELLFTAGSTANFLEGQVLTGAGGATGTIRRLNITSGDFSLNTAVGSVTLSGIVGTFNDLEAITTATGSATANGTQTAITLLPGGRWEFTVENFIGSTGERRMYGADGVNPGFDWDGTYASLIRSTVTPDTPRHVLAHKGHLIFSFDGGSVVGSGVQAPNSKSLVEGAWALPAGDDVVAMQSIAGGIAVIYLRSGTRLLYGNDATDFEIRPHTGDAGCIEWTDQVVAGYPVVYDDIGFTMLQATSAYGDFIGGTFSDKVYDFLESRKGNVVSSLRVKKKNQYRVYFDDGKVITVAFATGGESKVLGFLRQDLGTGVVINCTYNGTDADGNEVLLGGATNGYVYELDAGTSLDGQPIVSFIRTAYNHLGTPQNRKRFFKGILELDAPTSATIYVTPDFSFGNTDITPSAKQVQISVLSGGGFWDFDTWGEFAWDAPAVSEGEFYIDGSGTNIGLLIYSSHTYETAHTLQGYTLHYAVRGLKR